MSADNLKRWELIKQATGVADFHKQALTMNPDTMSNIGMGALVGGVGGAGKALYQNFDKDPDDEDRADPMLNILGGAAAGGALGLGYDQTFGAPKAPAAPQDKQGPGPQGGDFMEVDPSEAPHGVDANGDPIVPGQDPVQVGPPADKPDDKPADKPADPAPLPPHNVRPPLAPTRDNERPTEPRWMDDDISPLGDPLQLNQYPKPSFAQGQGPLLSHGGAEFEQEQLAAQQEAAGITQQKEEAEANRAARREGASAPAAPSEFDSWLSQQRPEVQERFRSIPPGPEGDNDRAMFQIYFSQDKRKGQYRRSTGDVDNEGDDRESIEVKQGSAADFGARMAREALGKSAGYKKKNKGRSRKRRKVLIGPDGKARVNPVKDDEEKQARLQNVIKQGTSSYLGHAKEAKRNV